MIEKDQRNFWLFVAIFDKLRGDRKELAIKVNKNEVEYFFNDMKRLYPELLEELNVDVCFMKLKCSQGHVIIPCGDKNNIDDYILNLNSHTKINANYFLSNIAGEEISKKVVQISEELAKYIRDSVLSYSSRQSVN